jgi:hypothetical protein
VQLNKDLIALQSRVEDMVFPLLTIEESANLANILIDK